MTSSTSNIFTKEFGSLDYTTSDNVKLLIQTHWKSKENEIDSLDIIIVSNNVVWKASVNRWIFEEKSIDLNLECNEYCDTLKYALVSPWGPKNDILRFNEGVLTWQKILKFGAFIDFGEFNFIVYEESGLIADTIARLVEANKLLREELELISEKNVDIERGWDDLTSKTEEMVLTKSQMEANLYSQFVVILNEKKKKIEELRRRANLGLKK